MTPVAEPGSQAAPGGGTLLEVRHLVQEFLFLWRKIAVSSRFYLPPPSFWSSIHRRVFNQLVLRLGLESDIGSDTGVSVAIARQLATISSMLGSPRWETASTG